MVENEQSRATAEIWLAYSWCELIIIFLPVYPCALATDLHAMNNKVNQTPAISLQICFRGQKWLIRHLLLYVGRLHWWKMSVAGNKLNMNFCFFCIWKRDNNALLDSDCGAQFQRSANS